LIVLRTIAIWNRNKVVVALTTIVCVICIGFHLQNVIRLRYAWNSTQLACEPVKTDYSVFGFIPTILSDMAMSLTTLAGLLNVRRRRGGGTLADLLWKQGVIWLAVGTVAEVPPLVFTLLHLNDQLHSMFETPGLIIMTIAATRMHRSLIDFASGSSDMTNESPQLTSLVLSKAKRTDTGPTALDRVEVSMHTPPEQYSTGPAMSGESTPTIVSTSEKIPEIVGDPSNLNLTRVSTCPLPTVSPSAIPGAQSV
jgi:hypothetical protein